MSSTRMDLILKGNLVLADGVMQDHLVAIKDGKKTIKEIHKMRYFFKQELELLLNRNGFEYASDAYAYIAHSQPKEATNDN